MKFQIIHQRWWIRAIHWFTRMSVVIIAILTSGEAAAYDNRKDPSFQAAKEERSFRDISVHPDGGHWLITESVKKPNGAIARVVLLYHLPTRTLKRYQLPEDYQFAQARFSASGRFVLMTRYPVPRDESEAEFRKLLLNGEIAIMNMDGTEFQVLPIPKGRIFKPAMSPDDTKLAYWLSKKERAPGERTLLTNFEIHEFDINSKRSYQFSRPLSFYEIHSIDYLSNVEIMLGAYGLLGEASVQSNIDGSHIHFLKRGPAENLRTQFSTFKSPGMPSMDAKGNVFFYAEIDQFGLSIVRQSSEKNTSIWRVPREVTDISDIRADPQGKYIAVLYNHRTPYRSPERGKFSSLALFQLKDEVWSAVFVPPHQSASPIKVMVSRQPLNANSLN